MYRNSGIYTREDDATCVKIGSGGWGGGRIPLPWPHGYLLPPDVITALRMIQNEFLAGAPPRNALRELTALPNPLTGGDGARCHSPKPTPHFALCLSALRVSGCSIGGGWLLFVGGSTPPVCTVVIMLNTTSYLVVVVYCQRVLTERREAVFKTVVQWSNSVVVMTVVRIQAAPLLWLVVVSAVLVTVTPWIVQQRWTGLVRRHRN